MRILCFWCGLAAAMLCGLLDPVWGYAAVFLLSLLQLALLGGPGASVFLLVHYTTLLTYFSLAPAIQIAQDLSFWEAGVIGTVAHTQALMLLLLYMAGVEAARFGVVDPPLRHIAGIAGTAPAPGAAHPLLLLGLLGAAFAVLLARADLNFVARGLPGEIENPPLDFIVYSTLPKLVVLMCFVALAIHALRQRTAAAWCLAALALAAAAIAANPVNTARQILLIGLLPLLIHGLGRSRRWTLAFVVFAAIAGLGPVFNLLSRGSMWGESLATFPYSPDFDAMYVVAGLLERAPSPDLGFGRYLLSGFSFVLPRDMKLFPDFDPLGWPAVLGNFSQSNLSLAQFATVFFDFGLPGPLVFGFLLSSLFRRVDRAIDTHGPISRGYLAALVLLAAYVPFMRGPILGWGPFAASGLIAALLVGALCTGFGPARRALAPRPATHA